MSNNIAEVSLRYNVDFICLSLVVEGSLRLSIELAATFSWSHMLKYRSLPWDEGVFNKVVDGIE